MPEDELDVLMERIRAELSARRAEPAAELPVAVVEVAIDPQRRRYHVSELLVLHDEAFVLGAHLAVLGREPDPVGHALLLERLRLADVSPLGALAELAASDEGRARGAVISGLTARRALERLRSNRISRAAGFVLRVLRNLPRLVSYMRQVIARVDAAERRAGLAAQQAAEAVEATRTAERRIARLEAELGQLAARLDRAPPRAAPGDRAGGG